jgi:hypothetical protein
VNEGRKKLEEFTGDVASSPSGLEIETARDTVDVDYFACEI